MVNTTVQVLHADCCWLSYYSVVVEERNLSSRVPGTLPSQLESCLLAKLKLAVSSDQIALTDSEHLVHLSQLSRGSFAASV